MPTMVVVITAVAIKIMIIRSTCFFVFIFSFLSIEPIVSNNILYHFFIKMQGFYYILTQTPVKTIDIYTKY